jgi:CheY-like chemotaxis protein
MATILVVDDEPINLKLALYLLRGAGHDVLGATGGAQAIELALAQPPDLVLLDIQMPHMDGIATLGMLRAEPRTAAITVAALTGLTVSGTPERLLEAGFDGYLTKPLQRNEFLASVAELLARRPA